MRNLGAAIHARVSEGSLAGWHAFAAEHGTTVSALIEVFGLELGEMAAGTAPDAPSATRLERIGARARELSQSRLRRRPQRESRPKRESG